MGLAWATTIAETFAVSRVDGGVCVGTAILGLGRLSPSRVGVGVAWVLI